MLATALINIQDVMGEWHECRAFLNPGAQTNFITQDLCNKLRLPQQRQQLAIRGIDSTRTAARFQTHAMIQSRFNVFKVRLTLSVLTDIIIDLPLSEFNSSHLKIPDTITLADPTFHIPSRIDVLLGSGIFWDLLCVGQIKLGRNQPIAKKTKLDWIIAGPMGFENQYQTSIASVCVNSHAETIDEQLERFWHVKEGAPYSEPSESDRTCEEEFVQTHRRRRTVRSPSLLFKGSVDQLGSSREVVIKHLKVMERNFARSPQLQEGYARFMLDY